MTGYSVDFSSTIAFQNFSSFREGAASVQNVIDQDCLFTFDISDDVTLTAFRIILCIINDGNWSIKIFSKTTSTFYTRVFRTNNNHIGASQPFVTVVFCKKWNCIEVIYRNVKESLNLNGMEIQCQYTTNSSFDQHICN